MTGGPCGGKTSGMARISEYFAERGWKVYVVPETATHLIGMGFLPGTMPDKQLLFLQQHIFHLQRTIEDTVVRLARDSGHPKVLVLFDRGLMDGKAYCKFDWWEHILVLAELPETMVRDRRYDVVIHMVSAAVGAEEHYTTENNPVRYETAAQAVEADRRTMQVWVGHPCLKIIDNSTLFEEKLRRTVHALCSAMGEPEPLERERKFLLRANPTTNSDDVVVSQIEQHYLTSPFNYEEHRVRKRVTDGVPLYYHTIKKPGARVGERVEVERIVELHEYEELLRTADPALHAVVKTRHCFVWNSTHFELDIYGGDLTSLATVEVETDDLDRPVVLPPWLGDYREVTGLKEFSNAALARHGIPDPGAAHLWTSSQ